jgi:hypothetical protein
MQHPTAHSQPEYGITFRSRHTYILSAIATTVATLKGMKLAERPPLRCEPLVRKRNFVSVPEHSNIRECSPRQPPLLCPIFLNTLFPILESRSKRISPWFQQIRVARHLAGLQALSAIVRIVSTDLASVR